METNNSNVITNDEQIVLTNEKDSVAYGTATTGSVNPSDYAEAEFVNFDLSFNNSTKSTGNLISTITNQILWYRFNTNNPDNHKDNKPGWYSLNFSSPDTKITGTLYERDNYTKEGKVAGPYYGNSINIAVELQYNKEYTFEVIPDDKNMVAILSEVFYSVYRAVPTKFITKKTKSITLEKGDKTVIQATDVAENECNKLVWHSSNPAIVSIDSNSGQVIAHKAGNVCITVSNACGYSHYFTLRSVIDYVDIMPDEAGFNKVVFRKTKKVWHCVNNDLIFDDANKTNSILLRRAALNYNSETPNNNGKYTKTYSDEELRLLYSIDPFGVAKYVQMYADQPDGCGGPLFKEKDRVFEVLFNRPPTYFAQQNNQWRPEPDNRNPDYVISESETLFGFHTMINAGTIISLIDAAIPVISAVIATIPVAGPIISGIILTTTDVVKTGVLLYVSENIKDENNLKSTLIDLANDSARTVEEINNIGKAIKEVNITWAMSLVSFFDNLADLFEVLYEGTQINFNRQIIRHCAIGHNYEVNIISENGATHILGEYV